MHHYGVLGTRRRVCIGFRNIYETQKDRPVQEAAALAKAGFGIDSIFFKTTTLRRSGPVRRQGMGCLVGGSSNVKVVAESVEIDEVHETLCFIMVWGREKRQRNLNPFLVRGRCPGKVPFGRIEGAQSVRGLPFLMIF